MKTIVIKIFVLFIITTFFGCKEQSQKKISLEGEWSFRIDPESSGEMQKWFDEDFTETIVLPGSMKENGKGNDPSLKTQWTASIYDSSWYFAEHLEQFRSGEKPLFPFLLTPKKEYVGAAWYQKEVDIPEDWAEKRVVLFLERAHWETTVWVDSKKIGTQNSLVSPHEYDLSSSITTGRHSITIRVDNRIKEINVGKDSHSISDHTQGNWNGVVGSMELRAMDKVWIKNLKVFPDVDSGQVKVHVYVINETGRMVSGKIKISANSFNSIKTHQPEPLKKEVSLKLGENILELNHPMGQGFLYWDEYDPALYELHANLELGNEMTANYETVFGMRKFEAKGTRFYVNGKPVFLRGNCDCAIFPLTGYPPTDLDFWMKIFGKQKSFGLNHIRFHSWSPPKAAFEAADRLGIYLQTEGPSWANHGTAIGDGRPVDQFIYDETTRINEHFGNHPSFCMMAYGNEPYGSNQATWLNKFVSHWKQMDSRHLYTGASVGKSWPYIDSAEFIVKSYPRGVPVESLPNSNFDHRKYIEEQDVPYISHEIGQYCVFPNFDEIDKYTGVYEPRNLILFREDIKNSGMLDQATDFLMASGKLQSIFYKAEIESALRTPGFAGFQMLQLNDFPGQGTALVGVLDAFFEEKGYIDSLKFRQFCDETVLLARLPKFVYKNDELLKASIEVSHFGELPLYNQTVRWELSDDNGKMIAHGDFKQLQFPRDNAIEVGTIEVDLNEVENASKLNLKLSLLNKKIENAYDLWVYPQELHMPLIERIIITDEFDADVRGQLEAGASVLLLGSGKVERGKEVEMHFKPVFWNTSWFKMRPPHTLGHLTQSDHPVFDNFPTEFHSNYQWWELVHKQQVMILDDFPVGFKPLVQPIDTWFLNRKLGLLFEARVGTGRLLVCSADITSDWENRPVARQLYYSVVNYMQSDSFEPEFEVDAEIISDLFQKKERKRFSTFSKETPDELQPKKID